MQFYHRFFVHGNLIQTIAVLRDPMLKKSLRLLGHGAFQSGVDLSSLLFFQELRTQTCLLTRPKGNCTDKNPEHVVKFC